MNEAGEVKNKILKASIGLFSQKGYEAASVSEIAKTAGVTKALIYYYFKNKEDILDSLVRSLLGKVTALTMDFVNSNIIKMIKSGILDIKPDRLSFAREEDAAVFLEKGYEYFEELLGFALKNRALIRILMSESLKTGKNRNGLFDFMNLATRLDDNPIFKTVSDADSDFCYSADMVMFKFFYELFPLINFAVYYDDYKAASGLSDGELRYSFIRLFKIVPSSLLAGKDIMLRPKPCGDTMP